MKSTFTMKYKGFDIEKGLYGKDVYSTQYCGDDLTATSLDEMKEIIKDIILCELDENDSLF